MKSLFALTLWVMVILQIIINEATVTGVKWNKRLRDFEPISGVRSYEAEKQRSTLRSRKQEIHNFNGKPLRIMYFEDPGFFEFYDNDTKAKGICGDIWTALSESLNFTLVLTKMERNLTDNNDYRSRGFYTILNDIIHNRTDVIPKTIFSTRLLKYLNFSPVLWTNRQRIFAHTHWKGSRGWMFTTFAIEVWALIVIFILTLSIASIVTQRFAIRYKVSKFRDRSYFSHLFYTFSSLCNQGNSPDDVDNSSRILTFTISIFSSLILIAHASCLIHDMTQEIVDKPYNDLTTLFKNTNLQILVQAGSLSHHTFFHPKVNGTWELIVKAKRISIVTNVDDLYRKVCSEPDKYVLFAEEDAVATRNLKLCRLFPVDLPRNPMLMASAISKRVKNQRSLEIGMMKLHEFGVINKITNRYASFKIEEPTVKRTTRLFVDVHRVSIIFAILGIGMLASVLICAMENIVFTLKKRKYK